VTTRPLVGSLFTGYGGLDIAVLQHYSADLAWVCEVDKHASALLQLRHPDVPNLGDITAINWEEVMPPDTPSVDILTAGYPVAVPTVLPRWPAERNLR
jgi:DNA (cytosine-5)-methyltransferase 1